MHAVFACSPGPKRRSRTLDEDGTFSNTSHHIAGFSCFAHVFSHAMPLRGSSVRATEPCPDFLVFSKMHILRNLAYGAASAPATCTPDLITCAPLGYDQSAVSAFISVTTDRSPSGD